MTTTTYRVVFDRVGRTTPPALTISPLDHDGDVDPDVLAQLVYNHVRPHLRSSEVDVVLDTVTENGRVVVGGWRTVGTFTITKTQRRSDGAA